MTYPNVLCIFLSKREFYRETLVSPNEIFCGPDCESLKSADKFHTLNTPPGVYEIKVLLDQLPPSQKPDLLVVKTDATGRSYPSGLDQLNIPKLLILGDTHHLTNPINSLINYARQEKFDFIISDHDRQHLHFFKESGFQNVAWIPCFNIFPHSQPEVKQKQHDVAFVGQAGKWHPYRRHILEYIHSNSIPLEVLQAPHAEAAAIYAKSRINLNISLNGDLNLRVFEVLSSGGFLLTDNLSPESGLELLFRDGEHLVYFENEQDCIEKIRYYLDHPDEAARIARNGYAEYLRNHTPEIKIQELMDYIFSGELNPLYQIRHDKRSITVKHENPERLNLRVAVYEFLQKIHLNTPMPLVLFWPEVDGRVICDAIDLPRLKFCIKNNGADIPAANTALLNQTGMLDRIKSVSEKQLMETSGSWNAVVITSNELQTEGLEPILNRFDFQWLIIPDGLDAISADQKQALENNLKSYGFEKQPGQLAVYYWKDKALWGEALYSENRITEATACFENVLQENPSNINALNNLGVLAFQLGDLKSSEGYFRRAISYDRHNINALVNVSRVYIETGQFDKGLEIFQLLVAAERENPQWWYQLGICSQNVNDEQKALAAFRECRRLGVSTDALNQRITALEKQPGSPMDTTNKHSMLPPKRILIINNIYPPQELGGYGRLLYDFANLLKRRGHSIYVLTSDTPYLGEVKQQEPEIDRSLVLFGGWQNGKCYLIDDHEQIPHIIQINNQRLQSVIDSFDPELCLLGNIDFLSHHIMQPVLERNIPVIHHLGNRKPGYDVTETPRNSGYHLATASHWLKEEVINQGYPFQDISVIYPGAMVNDYKMPAFPAFDKLRIAYAGIMLPYKGPHLLIQALNRLQHAGIDFTCEFAGTSTDNHFVNQLDNFVKTAGMQEKVRFAGFLNRDELKDLFARSNVLVFPSIVKEAFGISQVEAMAAGLTVVTSGTGGAREIIDHGETGIIFETENEAALADELIALGSDTKRWEKITRSGNHRAITSFDIERSVDMIEQIFAKLQNKLHGGSMTESPEQKHEAIRPLMEQEKYNESISALENLLKSHPDFARAHSDLGLLYYNTGDLEKSQRSYETAVQLEPDNIQFIKNLAAYNYLVLQNIEQAMQLYLKVLEKDPKEIETLLTIGNICASLKKYDDAEYFYNQVLQHEAGNPGALEKIAFLNQMREKDRTALSADEMYRNIKPSMDSGDYPKVIAELHNLLEVYPGHALAHADLGALYYNDGDTDNALNHYQLAVELDPGNIAFQKSLAMFYYQGLGRLEDALQIFLKIMENHPKDIEILINLGNICRISQKNEDADFFYNQALAIDPANEFAQKCLQGSNEANQLAVN